ncbi:hypothetical protein BaRGS_00021247, partial [Batillaria attramentaria]
KLPRLSVSESVNHNDKNPACKLVTPGRQSLTARDTGNRGCSAFTAIRFQPPDTSREPHTGPPFFGTENTGKSAAWLITFFYFAEDKVTRFLYD